MPTREYLLLAKDYEPDSHYIAGYYVSLKLDGQRCFWDGGVSRGLVKDKVPWANLKDSRKESQTCTGLWSRYGNIIHAPGWFLDELPKDIFLDGELYMGRQKFQETRSIVSTFEPSEGWYRIKLHVFDMPTPHVFFTDGKINNQNFKQYIDEDACHHFLSKRLPVHTMNRVLSFQETVQRMLRMKDSQNTVWRFAPQLRLPFIESEAKGKLFDMLEHETSLGGEGLILRAPGSQWVPKRTVQLLKIKTFKEDEATIIGYTAGEGKFLGMLGALKVVWNAKQFYLSGFNDEERLLKSDFVDWAKANPGKDYQGSYNISPRFRLSESVRFRYRELTNDGKPKEARFFR